MSNSHDDYEGDYVPDGDFDEDDPFATPPKAINFSDEWTAGETYTLRVLEKPRVIQGLDNKRKPAFWPDGKPKQVAVTAVLFEGERRSLWAPIPSALFKGIREATATARTSVRPGGDLVIPYLGVDQSKKEPGKNAPHAFGEIIYIVPGS